MASCLPDNNPTVSEDKPVQFVVLHITLNLLLDFTKTDIFLLFAIKSIDLFLLYFGNKKNSGFMIPV